MIPDNGLMVFYLQVQEKPLNNQNKLNDGLFEMVISTHNGFNHLIQF